MLAFDGSSVVRNSKYMSENWFIFMYYAMYKIHVLM